MSTSPPSLVRQDAFLLPVDERTLEVTDRCLMGPRCQCQDWSDSPLTLKLLLGQLAPSPPQFHEQKSTGPVETFGMLSKG